MNVATRSIFEKVRLMGIWWTFFGGHISIGPFTIFGANAMNWSLVISGTRWGHLHIDLPAIARWRQNRDGKWMYYSSIYASPNGTPWACTWYWGTDKNEVIRARIRRLNFGHNFNTKNNEVALRTLNNKYHLFNIGDYAINQYGPKEGRSTY